MSSVDRDLPSMPIPSFAYPDRHDSRVFIRQAGQNGKISKRTIGYMTDSTPGQERMVPNRYFRDYYPELYSKAYPDRKLPAHEMSVGMYAMTLGIATETGLYEDLRNIYGAQSVNAILDYVMFSIQHRSNVTQVFGQSMARDVLFSDRTHSDSWYSTFFSKKISEDQHHAFRIRRIERLAKAGLKKVWLSIDGSNNDCEARQSALAQFGFPKSHNKSKTVVGYMYAVDAATGEPVTYFTYDGSVPDCQAFQKISVFLNSFHIEIEGVILDRGFAVPAVFDSIESYGWKYVVMLPSDTYAHLQMMKEHADEIRWRSDYLLEDTAMFGIADTRQLFKNNARVSRTCMFFDAAGGCDKSMKILRKVQAEKRKILKAIAGGNKASVSKDLKKYLSINGDGPDRTIQLDTAALDASMSSKGFFSMAVTEGISPSMADRLYRMRDASETQFSILKTQEGGAATYVHYTEGILSKFAMLFISSIVRFEIMHACQKFELPTNQIIQSLRQVALLYSAEEQYESVRNIPADLKKLFREFSIDQDDIERIAQEYNSRNNTDARNPDRRLPYDRKPVIKTNSHKRGRPRKQRPESDGAASEQIVKSKGGRPKGKKDSKPRKPRSDKGVPRKKRSEIKN